MTLGSPPLAQNAHEGPPRPREGKGGGSWHILTGEYPPEIGGVGDYSRLVAIGLAAAGHEVHVWCPSAAQGPDDPGVTVHRTAGDWSRRDLARLGRDLDACASPRRLLPQYTPNAFRGRGMNLGFGRWLRGRRRLGDSVRVTFHEVRYSLQKGDGPKRRLLVAVQNQMARDLLRASSHLFLTIPAWVDLLGEVGRGDLPPWTVAPVPSNVPVVDNPAAVEELRRRFEGPGGAIVGTFSSFGASVAPILASCLPDLLLGDPTRVALLIGREGDAFAKRLVADHPDLAGRVFATGTLPPGPLSLHLQVPDLLIQVEPLGISGKSGTAMAALSHARPIVAGRGPRTEPHWVEDRCVALAPDVQPAHLLALAEGLLGDEAERARLALLARSTYGQRYAIERTIEALLKAEAEVEVEAQRREARP